MSSHLTPIPADENFQSMIDACDRYDRALDQLNDNARKYHEIVRKVNQMFEDVKITESDNDHATEDNMSFLMLKDSKTLNKDSTFWRKAKLLGGTPDRLIHAICRTSPGGRVCDPTAFRVPNMPEYYHMIADYKSICKDIATKGNAVRERISIICDDVDFGGYLRFTDDDELVMQLRKMGLTCNIATNILNVENCRQFNSLLSTLTVTKI
jgi:hypothetical protein